MSPDRPTYSVVLFFSSIDLLGLLALMSRTRTASHIVEPSRNMAPVHRYFSTTSIDIGSTGLMLTSHSQNSGLAPFTATEDEKPRCRICWEGLEEKPSAMPCGHYWCASCVRQACKSVRNESQWPIRCSKIFGSSCHISFNAAKPFLPHKEIQRLTPLIEEFESPKLGRS